MGAFVLLLFIWLNFVGKIDYILLMSGTIFDKAMLYQLDTFALPIIKLMIAFTLLANVTSVLILQEKYWALRLGKSLGYFFIIAVTALCTIIFINIPDLLLPGMYHAEIIDYHKIILYIRIILAMLAIFNIIMSAVVINGIERFRLMIK